MDVHGCKVKGEDKLQLSQWSWDYLIDYALKENTLGKPKKCYYKQLRESLILLSPFTSCLPGFAAEATKFLQELYCSQLEKKGG